MIKNEKWLIVLDLDGTMLKDGGLEFHPYNKKILDELSKQGHIVTICTGRPLRSTIKIYNDLGLNTLLGNYNGGRISHPQKKLYKEKHHLINKSLINKVLSLSFIENSIVNFIIEFSEKVYKHNDDGHLLKHMQKLDNLEIKQIKKDINNKLKINTDPFSMLIDIKGAKDVTGYFSNIVDSVGEDLFVRFWSVEIDGSFVIELNPRNSNKFKFVKEAANYYNINMTNVIAFGDGDNDIEMLKNTSVGVAMSNATDNVKQYANKITKFNNNDAGVGKFLNEYFKLNIK